MTRAPFAFLLVFVATAPIASAGSEAAPEIVDAGDDTNDPVLGGGDILAAWIENETAEHVTTVIKLASFDPLVDRLTDHYFAFNVGDTIHCTFVYAAEDGSFEFAACERDAATLFQSSSEPTTGSVTAGSPAYVRAVFPLARLEDDATRSNLTLTSLVADTFDFKRVHDPTAFPSAGGIQRVDHAESEAMYVLGAAATATQPTSSEPPAPQSEPPTPPAIADEEMEPGEPEETGQERLSRDASSPTAALIVSTVLVVAIAQTLLARRR